MLILSLPIISLLFIPFPLWFVLHVLQSSACCPLFSESCWFSPFVFPLPGSQLLIPDLFLHVFRFSSWFLSFLPLVLIDLFSVLHALVYLNKYQICLYCDQWRYLTLFILACLYILLFQFCYISVLNYLFCQINLFCILLLVYCAPPPPWWFTVGPVLLVTFILTCGSVSFIFWVLLLQLLLSLYVSVWFSSSDFLKSQPPFASFSFSYLTLSLLSLFLC